MLLLLAQRRRLLIRVVRALIAVRIIPVPVVMVVVSSTSLWSSSARTNTAALEMLTGFVERETLHAQVEFLMASGTVWGC